MHAVAHGFSLFATFSFIELTWIKPSPNGGLTAWVIISTFSLIRNPCDSDMKLSISRIHGNGTKRHIIPKKNRIPYRTFRMSLIIYNKDTLKHCVCVVAIKMAWIPMNAFDSAQMKQFSTISKYWFIFIDIKVEAPIHSFIGHEEKSRERQLRHMNSSENIKEKNLYAINHSCDR